MLLETLPNILDKKVPVVLQRFAFSFVILKWSPLIRVDVNIIPDKFYPLQVLRSPSAPYQPQDDEGSLDNDNVGNSTPMRAYRGPGGVVNRLGREQDRWKRQLEIQRYSVYDRHTMLN